MDNESEAQSQLLNPHLQKSPGENKLARTNLVRALKRRRFICLAQILGAACICVALVLLAGTYLARRRKSGALFSNSDRLDSMTSLKGPPTNSFRDNLRSDTKYVTAWGSGGWTNDVIGAMNLIYLGLITERVALLPDFLPSRLMLTTVGTEFATLPFTEVFDLPYLRKTANIPILEWREVKAPERMSLDDLGCWSVWQSVQYEDADPRQSYSTWDLQLDVSYTKTPEWIKMRPEIKNDRFSSFWALATLAYPSARESSISPPLPNKHNVTLPPDDQLLCFDFLYYVAAYKPHEIELDYSPAWRFVGQHMRWTKTLSVLAEDYVRRSLGLHSYEKIPPFITVHVRHGDFRDWCEDDVLPENCFAPMGAIQRRVTEVRDELSQVHGIEAKSVIVTSDETNENWWHLVEALGWRRVDHSSTIERYGEWYPILIDAVIQSSGSGFVGTARSTVSILARRRVESWQNGPTRMVRWGRLGSDDH
ncbi:unnamed protein product [Mycena citricolor]|uniref:GDP-fucose protein O-fucosyltransferase n=1 Tax=Mycena citricolor TaxID=2018698 RepID=A0AAD2HR68_9AGAR|nr:unnamed protein product [Mycena citricolor]